jgi:single-strand DNA-binding protein
MNEATVTITGNVATQPENRSTERGDPMVRFRLACTPRRHDRGSDSFVDLETSFVTVVCFRSLAENVFTSIGKGDPVVVCGRLRVLERERDGRPTLTVQVDALAIGHDLNRGTTTFTRVKRETAPGVSAAAA